MNSDPDLPIVQIGQESHSLNTLTKSYFVVEPDSDVTNNTTYPVVIHHPGGERIETKVRTHVLPNNMVKCRFNDLSIQQGDRVKSWANQFYKSRQGDVLNNVSYDQIAKGDTGVAQKAAPKVEKEKKSRKQIAVVVLMALVLSALGYVVASIVVKSNYVTLENGALIGNYYPTQASAEGTIDKLNIKTGDYVTKGQLLFSITNSTMAVKQRLAEVDVHTSLEKVRATEKLIKAEEKKLELVAQQLDNDIKIAQIDRDKSVRLLVAQQATINRISPLMHKRYISRLEFKKETDLLKELEATVESRNAKIEILESRSKTITEGKLYFLGGNVDNSLSNFQADMILRKAELAQSEAALEAVKQKAGTMEVRAAFDGKVYAIYRETGEYVEARDSVLAINRSKQPWAFATVRRNKAINIKQGDKIDVLVPAYNRMLVGEIASIGHRALYTEAGWSHDFRVDNSQTIPIKVALPTDIGDIPTGTRLKMIVPLPLKWPWE